MNEGDTDRALFSLSLSHEPGAADLVKSLTNATHDDPVPSADQVPQTQEQFNAWTDAGLAARKAGNWETALGLFTAASHATGIATPGEMAMVYGNLGLCQHNLGDDDTARQYMEWALPNLADDNSGTYDMVRKYIKDFGGAHETAADQTPASVQVAAGIEAYEKGDAHGARTALQAALHLDGPDEQKGRARYYLGAMDYQEHKYADARVHIEAAVQSAPEPEKGWAETALHWRWQEEPAP
jgi:Tfp pilus assembly protein PilF